MKMVHEYGRTYKCSKFSLLHLISIYGLSRVCATLLKRHVDTDVESRDAKGRSPLTWAAHNGHLQVVKLVLDAGAKVGSADEEGHTPLSCAARNGYLDVVKWLLQASYGVDSGDELDALTALRWATMTGHLEVVKLLLDAQTKKNPSFGQRAFGWAATYGHFEVMKLLMNNM
jgi:ankyrin repeat protein